MNTNDDAVRTACQDHIDRFFSRFHNAELQRRSNKALRLLRAADTILAGSPEGWAAGVIYAAANADRQACGVPGLLNREFEEFFNVSMGTVRRRAATVARETAM